jgi:hypothetical protein
MYLDWIAGILELLGKWVTGNKNRWGHAINFVCCVMWVVYVFASDSTYGLLLVVVPAMAINIRNFIKWTREAKKMPLVPEKRSSQTGRPPAENVLTVSPVGMLLQQAKVGGLMIGINTKIDAVIDELGLECSVLYPTGDYYVEGTKEQLAEFQRRLDASMETLTAQSVDGCQNAACIVGDDGCDNQDCPGRK